MPMISFLFCCCEILLFPGRCWTFQSFCARVDSLAPRLSTVEQGAASCVCFTFGSIIWNDRIRKAKQSAYREEQGSCNFAQLPVCDPFNLGLLVTCYFYQLCFTLLLMLYRNTFCSFVWHLVSTAVMITCSGAGTFFAPIKKFYISASI